MGILNVTPDSFSDGGEYLDPQKAIARGFEMLEEGATIIDVGGESTKPGAERVTMDEELTRVIPVIHALAKSGAMVSVDTMRAEVAALAVTAGARIINDVSGGLDLSIKNRATKKAFDISPIDSNRVGLFFSPNKELNFDIAKQIRILYLSGISQRKLGEMFNVSRGCIQGILKNKTWIENE